VLTVFKFLGLTVGLYVAYCVITGVVYARHRMWGRTFRRDEEPVAYWSAIAGYGALALMLVFVFLTDDYVGTSLEKRYTQPHSRNRDFLSFSRGTCLTPGDIVKFVFRIVLGERPCVTRLGESPSWQNMRYDKTSP
jgi:hypothetical protein